MNSISVGVIGCSNISPAYFHNSKLFEVLKIVACADIIPEVAKIRGEEYNVRVLSVKELLSDPEIDIVLNLTTPGVNAEIAMAALEAGKSTSCEKPLAVSVSDGAGIIEKGRSTNQRVGCAPDTFFGGGHQTCRKLIDDGWIGKPISGTAFMMCHGHESWHPNPAFYYKRGGGPMFDMGPYYLSALVNLLGPVESVCASTARTSDERIATSTARKGDTIPVEVTTHLAGTLLFNSGAIVTMVMSFDVWHHTHSHLEIYGTEGSMCVPDPNGFGGLVRIRRSADKEWQTVPLSHGFTENSRIIGVADMAHAMLSNRTHRCSGELAYHVLEVMSAFDKSSEFQKHIQIQSTCERPAMLPMGLNNILSDG